MVRIAFSNEKTFQGYRLNENEMRMILCSILFLAFITNPGFIYGEDSSTSVLFIGNSYTYYHSMPELFKRISVSRFSDQKIDVKFVGWGGATLKQLWENSEAQKEIRSRYWDYVVLQEQSMLGKEIIENGESYIQSPDQFFEYASKFVQLSLENDTKPVFYMTWSRKKYHHQQKFLSYAYMKIARETGSMIAPVGLAWDELRSAAGFNLYERDGTHPSIYGSYLSALMLFSVIFDADPVGISGRLKGYEILNNGKFAEEKSLLCDLPENKVEIIQRAVYRIFELMKIGDGYIEVENAVSDKKPSRFSKVLDYLADSKNQFIILVITVGMIFIVKGSVLLFKK